MKFAVFFITISIFLTLDIQQCFGVDIPPESLNRGDFIGVQSLEGSIEYAFVKTSGESPFRTKPISCVYRIADEDYVANVEKIYGEIFPEWVSRLLLPHLRRHNKDYDPSNLRKGDLVGVQTSANTIDYRFVERSGESPFRDERISVVHEIMNDDYQKKVKEIIGDNVPSWVRDLS